MSLDSVCEVSRALYTGEYVSLGMKYLDRLRTWSELMKRPEDIRGEAAHGVIVAIAHERGTNDAQVGRIRWAFRRHLLGLGLITMEAAPLAGREVL